MFIGYFDPKIAIVHMNHLWGVLTNTSVKINSLMDASTNTRALTQVYGVDVGYGQVAERVRVDPRVLVMERTNLRTLTAAALPSLVDIATLDLSFISVLKVLPAVVGVMQPSSQLVILIKPQFEAGAVNVSKGGVVRSSAVHDDVISRITCGVEELGFTCAGVIESPIRGAQAGNKEFLAHFIRIDGAQVNVNEWLRKWAPPMESSSKNETDDSSDSEGTVS